MGNLVPVPEADLKSGVFTPAQPVDPGDLKTGEFRPGSTPTTLGDFGKSVGTGFTRGVADSPGFVGDIANLLRTGYAKMGLDLSHGINGRDLLGTPIHQYPGADRNPFKTTPDIDTLLDQAGIDYQPRGDVAKKAAEVAHFAGNTVGLGGGSKLVKAGLGEATPLLQLGRQGIKDLVAGTGAGAGSEAATAGADAAGIENPYGRAALNFLGALAGGTAGAVGANRFRSLDNAADRPDMMSKFEQAGVEPRFPSDVGQPNAFWDRWLPARMGARNYSADSAAKTQQEISDHAKGFLQDPARIPGETDPEAIHFGARLTGETPKDLGQSISAAAGKPVSDVPETAPDWLLAQTDKGPSRVDQVLGQANPDDAGKLGRQLILHAGTDPDGSFNLDKLMQWWKTRDPQAQDALTAHAGMDTSTGLGQQMKDLSTLYDSTAGSRGLIGSTRGSAADPYVAGGAGFLASQLFDQGLNHVGIGTVGALGAAPVLARGLAGYGQRSSFVGRGLNTGETVGHTMGAELQNFPDTYHPAPATPTYQQPPPGSDIHSWLQSTDRPSAVSYVAQRLGPQAGAQLESAGDEGFKAAMMTMSADPQMRAALAPGDAAV